MKNKKYFKIKIFGSFHHDRIYGFFTSEQINKKIISLKKELGNDWGYVILPAEQKS